MNESTNAVVLIIFTTDCPEGTYGEYCISKCVCKPGVPCDAVTGRCICSSGWKAPNCTESKWYGTVKRH